MKVEDFDLDAYVEWLKSRCQSLWEGCMCHLPSGHSDPIHQCIAEGCGCTWTTEQADDWHDGLKAWMKEQTDGDEG